MERPELLEKVAAYTPGEQVAKLLKDIRFLFLVGISGAGKDMIIHALLRQFIDYYRLISYTTRQLRANNGVMEHDGVEYHFIDFDTAEQMLKNGEYIEANVYSNNVYGTSIKEVERAHADGKILVTDVDVNGVDHFMQLAPLAKPVFILPPSFEVWFSRLLTRYTDYKASIADIHRRVDTARAEIEHVISKDYYYLLINDDLSQAVDLANKIAHGEATEKRSPKAEAIMQELLARLRNWKEADLLSTLDD